MPYDDTPAIGDVLCVRTYGLAGEVIRFGEALLDQDNLDNHIAVVHHKDKAGTWWAIEGRPGGVGWADASSYLSSRYTITNRNQGLTDANRVSIAQTMEGLLGVPYDWRAIAEDAVRDLHLDDLWAEKWKGTTAPGHVVCSSVAAYAYKLAGVKYPTQIDTAHVEPSDWVMFIEGNNFE